MGSIDDIREVPGDRTTLDEALSQMELLVLCARLFDEGELEDYSIDELEMILAPIEEPETAVLATTPSDDIAFRARVRDRVRNRILDRTHARIERR